MTFPVDDPPVAAMPSGGPVISPDLLIGPGKYHYEVSKYWSKSTSKRRPPSTTILDDHPRRPSSTTILDDHPLQQFQVWATWIWLTRTGRPGVLSSKWTQTQVDEVRTSCKTLAFSCVFLSLAVRRERLTGIGHIAQPIIRTDRFKSREMA